METLEFGPLEGKKLTVVFAKKVDNPSAEEIKHLKSLIEEYNPDFATEELGDREIDDFNKRDPYSSVFRDAGVLLYPVDISEYAKTSISAIVDEKGKMADMVEASSVGGADAEYIRAYADALRVEYEELRVQEEISVRNDWMVKGILDCANKVSKEDILCIFIGGPIHWEGMTKTLESIDVKVCTDPYFSPNKIRNTFMEMESTELI